MRVNCVSPGLIGETAFHGRFTPRAAFEAAKETSRSDAPARPRRSRRVIAFLASPDASFLTGETIEINGGMLMR